MSFRIIILLILLSLSAKLFADIPSSTLGSDYGTFQNGYVFIHTAKGNISFSKNSEKLNVTQFDFMEAKGLSVTISTPSRLTMVLSNSLAICAEAKCKFTIEKFEQVMPFAPSMDIKTEKSRTVLVIFVEYGKLYFSAPNARSTSKTTIKTTVGNLEPQATDYIVQSDGVSFKTYVLKGQMRFFASDGRSDFLKENQCGTYSQNSTDKKYPLEAQLIAISEIDAYEAKLKNSRSVAEKIYFYFDDSKKLAVKMLVSKEFFLRKPKYDHRPF